MPEFRVSEISGTQGWTGSWVPALGLTPSAGMTMTSAGYFVDGAKVASSSTASVALRYRDVAAASDWLCAAFGFQKHLAATSETGVVHYAQLSCGDAMLMLAQVRDTALDKYMKQPDEIGGAETQGCYFRVGDVEAHYARSKAAGADIVLDLQDDAFGGRSYACRDPEGHIWSFGTYDPWQGKRPGESYGQSERRDLLGMRRSAVIIGLLATIVASALVAAGMYGALEPKERSLEAAAQASLKTESSAREAAEQVAREALEQLGRERIAKQTAERSAELAGKRMTEEQRARNAAEDLVREVRQELERLRQTREPNRPESEKLDGDRKAKELAERNAEQASQRASEEQSAKEAAERTAQEMREQLDRNREAKELAERNAEQARQRASEERSAKEAAERAAQEMREQLDRNREAKEVAERSAEQARLRASEEQSAREVAERAANEARAQLGRERNAKNAALKAAAQLRRQLNQEQNTK
jgi:uncharacterized glyoxalase superfamily protein PhnB